MDQFGLMLTRLLLGAAHGGDVARIDVDIAEIANGREEQ